MRTMQRLALVALVLVATALPASAETLQYNWSMHGGLSWIAGFKFPTSGTGLLTQNVNGQAVTASLRMTSPKEPSAALYYESTMAAAGERTLASAEGYNWRTSVRHVKSFFDSVKRVLHLEKTTAKGTEASDKPWISGDVRDFLTSVQFLRTNGHRLSAPVQSTIYSSGKAYPVTIAPLGVTTMNNVATQQFRIQAAPGAADKYPGEIRLWISADARRVPVRIELAQRMATVRLDLSGV